MRIAQVSPLFESVPPKLYGGTERVVSWLTEELVRQGHQVTLFASADSTTEAALVPCCPRALRLDGCREDLPHHVRQLEEVYRRAGEFDVIHFHTDLVHLPLARRSGTPHVTTVHGRLDSPELAPLYRLCADAPLVSISDAQRAPLSFARWYATVHHGMPLDLLRFTPGPGKYLAFLGRISPEKGPERALELAKRVGIPLKIAAKVDAKDREYFEQVIRPRMDTSLVEFVGEIGERDKERFLGDAIALVFLIDWPEPFGLVMIEAMACGTPVIAWRCGSVPEVVEEGGSGTVVDDMESAAWAAERVAQLPRARVRRSFEHRFDVSRMAREYLAVYEDVIETGALPRSIRPVVRRVGATAKTA